MLRLEFIRFTVNLSYNASVTGGSGGVIPTIQGLGRGIAGIPVRTARVPMPVSAYPPSNLVVLQIILRAGTPTTDCQIQKIP